MMNKPFFSIYSSFYEAVCPAENIVRKMGTECSKKAMFCIEH
jgi:hypothetical protein